MSRRLAALALGTTLAAAATGAAERPLETIGFLVVPGVYNTELMAPYDVLHHLRFHVKDAPEIFTVAKTKAPVVTFEGLTLTPHHDFSDAPPIDLLVVPSAEGSMQADLEDEALLAWVRRAGARARLLLSLCDGAFLLAQAGLLDGLEATTFPADQDRFAQAFPQVKLKRGPLFVHDGKAVTSVGGARSYEPAFYLVEALYGKEAAQRIGRGLVIDWDLTSFAWRRGPAPLLPQAASRR